MKRVFINVLIRKSLKVLIVVLINIGCFSLISANSLEAQQEKVKKKANQLPQASNYRVKGTESKIKVDGSLDEIAWENAVKIGLPYEYYPGDNTPAPVKTECLVTFSKSTLYFGIRCLDPEPQKIRAHLMDRDAMETFVQDDYIIILLDTFNDERRAFQFRVNPLGVQADASFNEMEGVEDFSWDAIWNSNGKITESGYIIEVAIPFNQLRFPRSHKEQTWGISIIRMYPRAIHRRLRSHPVDRNRQCTLCQANKITGFMGISPGHNLEFDPTLTLSRTDKREDFPYGELEAGKLDVEPGLTARWGITSSLILNGTINPDFSQVEADAAQLEVNTRFALRYPEKRPFFLEGQDFFATPLEIVFTRTVYDPVWGAKLTGKLGRNALGFFATQDKYNNLLFPSNQGSSTVYMEDDVYSAVLRYRRDIGKGSTLGALYTGRVGDDYFNHVIGADGFFRLSPAKTLTFQLLQSQTQYPDLITQQFNQPEDSFGGTAILANFLHYGRNFHYSLGYQDYSKQFRADYGYMPRVDMREVDLLLEPVLWGKKGGWFHQITFRFLGERITTREGMLTDQNLWFIIHYWGPLQTFIVPSFIIQKEWHNGITYDKKFFQIYLETKPMGGLKLSLATQIGDTIDYSNGRLAKTFLFQPSIDFSPDKNLNINLNHTLEHLSFEGDNIYTANLLQAKLDYNFNIRTFARFIFQYLDVSRNQELYLFPVSPESKTLFTQFLFAYKINPQTKVFIGYSDNHYGIKGIDLTRTDRTFFLKIGYALVY